MPSYDQEAFPQIRSELLHDTETVIEELSTPTIAISGLACAIDLRNNISPDPLGVFENAIGKRLACDFDEDNALLTNIRIGSTYLSVRRLYDKKRSTPPGLLIAQFDVLAVDVETDPTVAMNVLIPFLQPGSEETVQQKTQYSTTTESKRKAQHGLTLLTGKRGDLKVVPNPYLRKIDKGKTTKGITSDERQTAVGHARRMGGR